MIIHFEASLSHPIQRFAFISNVDFNCSYVINFMLNLFNVDLLLLDRFKISIGFEQCNLAFSLGRLLGLAFFSVEVISLNAPSQCFFFVFSDMLNLMYYLLADYYTKNNNFEYVISTSC